MRFDAQLFGRSEYMHTKSKNNFKKCVNEIQIVGYNGTSTDFITVAILTEAALLTYCI